MSKRVQRLQTRGLWGARDIHRRPLLFNIPLYNGAAEDHERLAEISKRLHRAVPKMKKIGAKKGISVQRRKIQKLAYAELKEIDKLVNKLLHLDT